MMVLIIPAILFLAEKNANNPKWVNQV
jgi:hypothetical protein